MLLYAVADIHGKKNNLSAIQENVRRYKPDLLIAAGDITNYFYPGNTVDRLAGMGVTVLTVRGNSDFPQVDRLIAEKPGVHSIHGKGYRQDGFHFIGWGGAVPLPFRTITCFMEKKRFRRIEPVLSQQSVLVMHPPPYGVLDRVLGKIHSGSRNIYNMILLNQPLLFLCGHIHEDIGHTRIGRTTVVNCSMGKWGDGAIIQLQADRAPIVKFIGR